MVAAKPSNNSVDLYVAAQTASAREWLTQLRRVVVDACAEGNECISYQMPSLKYHGMVVWYAVTKTHYGVYFVPEVIDAFKERLKGYVLAKSAVKIPLDAPVPVELLTDMVRFAAQGNLAKKILTDEVKKAKRHRDRR